MARNGRNGKLVASLSILCAVAASLMPTLSRLVYQRSTPGDDAYFSILMLMPILYLAGLVLAVVARRKAGPEDPLAKVALWLNLGLLAALALFAVWGVFSYQGR